VLWLDRAVARILEVRRMAEKLGKERDERMSESREMVLKAMMMALGAYVEQESKKQDEWRDKTIGEIYSHIKHEVEEIRRSLEIGEKTILLHNALDLCSLGAILAAKVMFFFGGGIMARFLFYGKLRWICPRCGAENKTIDALAKITARFESAWFTIIRDEIEVDSELSEYDSDNIEYKSFLCPNCKSPVTVKEVKDGLFRWLEKLRQEEPKKYDELMPYLLP
jgi:ribosomal protein S27AE